MQYVTKELGAVDLKAALAADGLLESRPDLAKLIRSGFTSYSVERDGVTLMLAGGAAAQRSHDGTPEFVTRDVETHDFRKSSPKPTPVAPPAPPVAARPTFRQRLAAMAGEPPMQTGHEVRVARQQAADARARSMQPTRVKPAARAEAPAPRTPPALAKRFDAVLSRRLGGK